MFFFSPHVSLINLIFFPFDATRSVDIGVMSVIYNKNKGSSLDKLKDRLHRYVRCNAYLISLHAVLLLRACVRSCILLLYFAIVFVLYKRSCGDERGVAEGLIYIIFHFSFFKKC